MNALAGEFLGALERNAAEDVLEGVVGGDGGVPAVDVQPELRLLGALVVKYVVDGSHV